MAVGNYCGISVAMFRWVSRKTFTEWSESTSAFESCWYPGVYEIYKCHCSGIGLSWL